MNTSALPLQERRRMTSDERKIILASSLGTVFEWYDFYLYGSLATVVGNPPFLGDKRMRSELGDTYTADLRKLYTAHVPGGADLVCYWFYKARGHIILGKSARAGLVTAPYSTDQR